MKIFYICYENLNVPAGWTTHIREVVNRLETSGINLTLFAPTFDSGDRQLFSKVVKVKCPAFRWFGEYSYYWNLLRALFRHVRKNRPDAFYIREMGLNIAPVIVATIFQIPIFLEINGLITEELRQTHSSRWKIFMVRLLRTYNLRHCKSIVAVTQELTNKLVEKYKLNPARIHVVENGVNTDLFHPVEKRLARSVLNLPEQGTIFLYSGSFYPHHGVYETLKLFQTMLGTGENCYLVMVGDGLLRKEIQRHVHAIGLWNRVLFPGYIDYYKLPLYVSAADLCVLLFQNNGGEIPGRSLKVLEYMACSRPIIVSGANDLRKLVNSFTCGIFLEDLNSDTDLRAVQNLVHDKNKQYLFGLNGRMATITRFSWQNSVNKIIALFDSLAKSDRITVVHSSAAPVHNQKYVETNVNKQS